MAKSSSTGDNAQFWLLAAVVVVVTAGVILWLGRGDEEAEQAAGQQEQAIEDNVVEIQPLIPRGSISSASWREEGGSVNAKDMEESTSLLDGEELDPFGEKAREQERQDEDLKEIVDRIHGLGVYVAPPEKDDK